MRRAANWSTETRFVNTHDDHNGSRKSKHNSRIVRCLIWHEWADVG